MKTKLTLSVRKETINRAKRWVKKHNTSLSEQVDKMLEELVSRPADYGKPRTSWVKQAFGNPVATGKTSQQLIDDALNHITTKHLKR